LTFKLHLRYVEEAGILEARSRISIFYLRLHNPGVNTYVKPLVFSAEVYAH